MSRGVKVGFHRQPYTLKGSPGQFWLAVYDAAMQSSGFNLAGDCGIFSLHGDAATMQTSAQMSGSPGRFAFVGRDATMLYSGFSLLGSAGVFSLAGHAATLTADLLTPLWPDPLPAGKVGIAYSYFLTVANAVGAVTYAVTAGALPAGLSLNASTGEVSSGGLPLTTAVSFVAVTFGATDSS
jgi:hypothetical protein